MNEDNQSQQCGTGVPCSAADPGSLQCTSNSNMSNPAANPECLQSTNNSNTLKKVLVPNQNIMHSSNNNVCQQAVESCDEGNSKTKDLASDVSVGLPKSLETLDVFTSQAEKIESHQKPSMFLQTNDQVTVNPEPCSTESPMLCDVGLVFEVESTPATQVSNPLLDDHQPPVSLHCHVANCDTGLSISPDSQSNIAFTADVPCPSGDNEHDTSDQRVPSKKFSEHHNSTSEDSDSFSDSDASGPDTHSRIRRMLASGEQQLGDSDDDEKADVPRTKNEEATDSVKIPELCVEVGPHHNLIPVGKIKSIIDKTFIIESLPQALSPDSRQQRCLRTTSDAVAAARALDIDTVLCLTEARKPLGRVFDIFGPVTSPFYIVRFNSKTEIQNLGSPACVGAEVSYIEEMSRVLVAGEIRCKGYDASNMYDEEIGLENLEFSDDEQEAAAKRARKRGNADLSRLPHESDQAEHGPSGDQSYKPRSNNIVQKNASQPSAPGRGPHSRHPRQSNRHGFIRRFDQRQEEYHPCGETASGALAMNQMAHFGQAIRQSAPSVESLNRRAQNESTLNPIYRNGLPIPSIHPQMAHHFQHQALTGYLSMPAVQQAPYTVQTSNMAQMPNMTHQGPQVILYPVQGPVPLQGMQTAFIPQDHPYYSHGPPAGSAFYPCNSISPNTMLGYNPLQSTADFRMMSRPISMNEWNPHTISASIGMSNDTSHQIMTTDGGPSNNEGSNNRSVLQPPNHPNYERDDPYPHVG